MGISHQGVSITIHWGSYQMPTNNIIRPIIGPTLHNLKICRHGAPAVLSAGLISQDSIQFFTTTTDFVTLAYFTGFVVFINTFLLVGVESGRTVSAQFRSSVLFSGTMFSIGSSLPFIELKMNDTYLSSLLFFFTSTYRQF